MSGLKSAQDLAPTFQILQKSRTSKKPLAFGDYLWRSELTPQQDFLTLMANLSKYGIHANTFTCMAFTMAQS